MRDVCNTEIAPGTLYVVATPIGHLDDLSPRAIAILRGVDRILAEDTRHSQKLLSCAGIQTPMQSYHRFNEAARVPSVLKALSTGASLALISDAGTPGVQDPGARLVAAAHDAGYRVCPIPGACAAAAAISASGWAGHFRLVGFLPAKTSERERLLEQWSHTSDALVIYESPRRLQALVNELAEYCGSRRVVWCRELTKLHEQVKCASLADLAAYLNGGGECRGESVLVIDGQSPAVRRDRELSGGCEMGGAFNLADYLAKSLPKKQAAQLAAKYHGIGVNEVYKHLLDERK